MLNNPEFCADSEAVKASRALLRAAKARAPRPVVFLSGYHSPSFPMRMFRRAIAATGVLQGVHTRVISYPFAMSIEGATKKAARLINNDPLLAGPIDLVGHSMGGIVARNLVRIGACTSSRLITLSTPHKGAQMAEYIHPDRASKHLRAGSELLSQLDDALPGYFADGGELYCYATLHDWMVGATRCAPAGVPLHWLDVHRRHLRWLSHYVIINDQRIVLDVALRLTGAKVMAGNGLTPVPRD